LSGGAFRAATAATSARRSFPISTPGTESGNKPIARDRTQPERAPDDAQVERTELRVFGEPLPEAALPIC
jgi:hypothetical protein